MLKRLMVLGGMLTMLLILAAPALAQGAPVTATGVLGEPYTEGEDPTVKYPFTDEATGKDYVLISGFVDLSPFVGQQITIEAAPVGSAPGVTPALNVTDVIESETGYDPAPLAVITGELQTLAEPIPEGGTHTVTEHSTGDVYMLWSDQVDLSQYDGQSVAVYGIFQTQGAPISDFEDPTDVLIAVTSVESLESLPVGPPTKDQYEADTPAEDQYETDAPAGDQYEGDAVEDGAVEDGAVEDSSSGDGESSGGILSVLPDTGGYSLAALGLISLLLLGGGGLLSYSLIRR